MNDLDTISFEECVRIVEKFYPCMNDYIFVYDIKNDVYQISDQALKRFKVPSSRFTNVAEAHRQFVYDEDYDMLNDDLNLLVAGKKMEHNIIYRWLDIDGNPIWINCVGRLLLDEEGQPNLFIGCINEVGNKPFADNTTGLLTVKAFEDKCNKANIKGLLLRIDIDDFKEINQKLGATYGDKVLFNVGQAIAESNNSNDEIYKLMGNGFLLFIPGHTNPEYALERYEQIRRSVSESIRENGYETVYTVSCGIIAFDGLLNGFSNMLKKTEFAVYKAKRQGKNQAYIFKQDDYDDFARKRTILQRMRESIENNYEGFELYYQPIVDYKTGNIALTEALLRYRLDDEIISPGEFIPILEESGLIVPVGEFIFQNAINTCNEGRKYIPDLMISINLSYVQILKGNDLSKRFINLKWRDLQKDSIIFELTESGYLDENENVKDFWKMLKKYGIKIAIDDFGSGYSNMRNIALLAPNIIKIDRIFTLGALSSEYEYKLLNSIIEMCHTINVKVVVEGVEDKQELDKIGALGPDYIQGYYYSKPLPKDKYINKINGFNKN